MQIDPKGNYEVQIEGVWYEILPFQMRCRSISGCHSGASDTGPDADPNPTGEGIVWYAMENGKPHIYCFAPGYLS